MSQPNTPDSKPTNVTFVTDIERARHLIPGFLKKRLDADDKEWMTQFLNVLSQQSSPEAADFNLEMAWVERSQLHLAQDAPAFDAQAGWQRMQGRLNAPAHSAKPDQPAKQAPLNTPITWLKTQIEASITSAAAWWRKPLIGVLASAMIVGQMGLLAAVVKQMGNMSPIAEGVTPSSGAPSLEGMQVLVVVFKDNASLLDVRTLIDSVQGRVIDGPGALGVWLVAVPKDKLDAHTKRLGSNNAVESVAPQ